MKTFLILLFLPIIAFSAVQYNIADGKQTSMITSTGSSARTDTLYLLGGPDRNDGKFQDDATGTIPDEEGWTGVDLTVEPTVWHVSTYRTGVNTAYCGDELIPSCGAGDPVGGYANSYWELLDWSGTAPDPLLPTTIDVTGIIWYDNEPGYDYTYFAVEETGGMMVYETWNGIGDAESFAVNVTVDPANYMGPESDQIHIQFIGSSDNAWSDEDCDWPTQGHTNLDDIAVAFNGTQIIYDDFEIGSGNWEFLPRPSVGDFSKVWPQLANIDPCNSNDTPQFAFIDDGIVVPGTGGTYGQTWTYGPGGFAVNCIGGLAGYDYSLNNEIWSPVLTIPEGNWDGCIFSFDVYKHQIIDNAIFYKWSIQSSSDSGQSWSEWKNHGYVYYGGPEYFRHDYDVSTMTEPGSNAVRVSLGVLELSYIWGPIPDPTPAPYFDNVAVKVFDPSGPYIEANMIDFAQDNFPASGELDLQDLSTNSVRFDMARNISEEQMLIQPGDSIVVSMTAVKYGSVFVEPPKMYWSMYQNPLFDPYRDIPGTAGWVYGDTTGVENEFCFDLPDEGFLFPGDIIHYYFKAEDSLGGVTTLPADLTGFGKFPADPDYQPLLWSNLFTMNALPTLLSIYGHIPATLFWNDSGDEESASLWISSLNELGYKEGVNLDVYTTKSPTFYPNENNGLGGRATLEQISGYENILYTSGDERRYALNSEPDNDIGLFDSWLDIGHKNMLLVGNQLKSGSWGSAASQFFSEKVGISRFTADVSDYINGQRTPRIFPIQNNEYIQRDFIANGGCPNYSDFDGINAVTATRIAEFTDPGGNGGVYEYAAATVNTFNDNQVVFLSFAYKHWITTDGFVAVDVLADILSNFNLIGVDVPDDEIPGTGFTLNCSPNPFNPRSKISYNMPSAGNLKITIFNIRGEEVCVLFNEEVEAGPGSITWSGKDESSEPVASGVYFVESRSSSSSLVKKLTLVR
ncbi:MAG: hypothetical protein GY752_11220 [bacterium]|nr:hypothetical protein [bacterium]